MDLTTYRNKLIGSEDERAVSPVIGVILMVAITVILAAVIAAFVLDIGDLDDSAPNAQFDWETSDDTIEVQHTSGDDIDQDDLIVRIEYADDTATKTVEDLSGPFTAGDRIVMENGDDEDINLDEDIDNVDNVVITWESDGTSTILTSYEP